MPVDRCLQRIVAMLTACATADRLLPATALYEEGWMLRLLLDWFSRAPTSDHPLAFLSGARWYSEALLRSQFLPRHRGDDQAETWTHADGVIGDFHLTNGRGDARLDERARQFVIVEAKMYSALSAGTKRAPDFDQAARTVACMAELLRFARRDPAALERLGFVVVAPAEQVSRDVFTAACAKESIAEKVTSRARGYGTTKARWLREWFLPTLDHVSVTVLSWEQAIGFVATRDPDGAADLGLFLDRCIAHNRPAAPGVRAGPPT